MKDKNLKRLFKLANEEGLNLRYLRVDQVPTKEQFFELLPSNYEHTYYFLDGKTDSTLKVYLLFNKMYCIENDGDKYLAHNMNEALAIHAYNIRLKEIDVEIKRLESTLTNK